MNKKFTKLIAALALLVFMTPSLVGWGQTRDVQQLTNANIVAAGSGQDGYKSWTITDDNNHTWNAYAIKKAHSNATSQYHFLQIRKYASNTAYYIQVPELGTQINSITMTVSGSSQPMTDGGNSATLYFSSSNSTSSTGTGVASGTGSSSVTIDCSSLNLNTGYITANGAVRIWDVSVTYTAGSLDDSDLAITGAPVALSFDLYNNASAQTVSYTTSSTGEVTITPATSNYFTYEHNATAKTITVTPTAVTPSAQTITISQAADGTYKAGEVSFTVEVANSTPTTNVTINDSGITNTDVYVGTAAGSLSATVTYDNSGTPAAVPGATVTWSGDNDAVATIASDGTVTLVGAGTVNFTASYAGASGQYLPSSATYELVVTSSAPYVQPNPVVINMNYQWLGSTNGGNLSASQLPVEKVDDNVTTIIAKGTSSTNPRGDLDYIRLYNGSTLTFDAPEGYVMTSIEFTTGGNNTWNAPSVSTGTLSSKTWTGNAESVVFTMTGSCFISKATITLAQLAPKHTLTITMSNVADFTVFVGDETVSGPDPENPSPTVQVSAGTTVGVSIGGMENCYLFGSLTVNGSTAGVTQDDPDDPYFEFTMPDEDAEIDVTTTDATPFTLTVVGMDNVSFDMYMGYNSTEVTITDGTASICEQSHVTIDDLTVPSGFILEPITLTYGNTTEEVNVALGFTMPSSNATLTFTTHEAASFTYTKVNSVMPGKHYIIVTSSTDNSGNYHAMGGKSSGGSYMDPIVVSVDNNTVTVAENEGVAEILISGTAGNYTLHTSEGYLVGGNKLMNTNGTESSTWSISFNDSDQAIITWTINSTGYSIQYNSASPRFACYSSSQAKVCLYEKNEPPTYELSIDAHTTNGGWNLIASPVTVDPAAAGMITDNYTGDALTPATSTYELYAFDNSEESEWRNYRSNQFNLEPGKGYLYASKNGGNFTLIGTPYSGDGEITLSGSSNTGGLANWNLIGNPYPVEAVISCDYYAMNDDGTDVEAKADDVNVAAMQGVFVVYDATTNPFVLFEPATEASTAPVGDDKFILNVSQNRGNVIDRAIVRMGESRQLPKFQLFENSTKLYIPQNGKDYAIVSTEAQGEMPVNFRAAENGTYTLSIDAENVEMNYLHLIDNMTGMDIDLLQTPSYTFEATTRDYESRFRLVFAANEDGVSTGSTAFAFFSNGNWIINNAGEAILQVIDITGRILSSESVNGSVSTTLNATSGVYMLRLINGENVKVQKIVVR